MITPFELFLVKHTIITVSAVQTKFAGPKKTKK